MSILKQASIEIGKKVKKTTESADSSLLKSIWFIWAFHEWMKTND